MRLKGCLANFTTSVPSDSSSLSLPVTTVNHLASSSSLTIHTTSDDHETEEKHGVTSSYYDLSTVPSDTNTLSDISDVFTNTPSGSQDSVNCTRYDCDPGKYPLPGCSAEGAGGDPGCLICVHDNCTSCKTWRIYEPNCKTYIELIGIDQLNISAYNESTLPTSWPESNSTKPTKKHRVYQVTLESQNDDVVHIKAETNFALVHNLRHNTWYNTTVEVCRTFRNNTDCDKDVLIPTTGKTSCRIPDQLVIEDISLDNYPQTLSILFSANGSGCDRAYVELSLNGKASQEIQTNSTANFTLGVSGDDGVTVQVVNNENLSSESKSNVTIQDIGDSATDSPKPSVPTAFQKNGDFLLIFTILPCAALLVVLVIGITMCVRRKKNVNRDSPETVTEDDLSSRNSIPDDRWLLRQREAQLSNQNGQRPTSAARRSVAIPQYKFQQYFEENQNQNLYKDKFKAIPVDGFGSNEAAQRTLNVVKNRYKNIIPYDQNRVKLPLLNGIPDSDYINASLVTGYNSRKPHYIAAQGPKPETVNDFWRMVVTYKVSSIVMLTVCRENVKQLCEQYWPQDVGSRLVYDTVVVKTESLEETAHYTIRSLSVSCKGQNMFLRHYQMTSWQDKTKPDSPLPMRDMIQRIRASGAPGSGPLLVHCSAGAGRTGTYIALDCLMDQLASEGRLDVDGVIYSLRAARPWMVQTTEQYEFIHEFLVTYLKAGDTLLNIAHLMYYSHGLDGLIRKHHQAVQAVTDLHTSDASDAEGFTPENLRKNRLPTVVPKEKFRAFLSLPVEGTNDYINAVYLNSFWHRDDTIVTQIPLAHTVVDFWRLIHDHRGEVVIILDNLQALGQSIPNYLPNRYEHKRTFGSLVVEMTGQQTYSKNANIIMSQLQLSRARYPNRKMNVRLYNLTSWTTGGSVPRSTKDITDLLNLFKHHVTSRSGKTIVQCLDGVSRSGLFCAAAHVLGQTGLWSDVDIPLSVLSMRERRPQFVINPEQFRFLYDLVQVNLSSNSTAIAQTHNHVASLADVITETPC